MTRILAKVRSDLKMYDQENIVNKSRISISEVISRHVPKK